MAVDTVPAITAKVAVVAPCATVTLAGIVSPAGELDRLTSAPPDAAGLVSVTVPVAEPPLVIVLGATATLAKAAPAGFTVTTEVWLTLRYEAVTVTAVAVDTVHPVTVKVAEVEPCATVMLAGIVSPAGELDRLTSAPPGPAGLVRVTVPVAEPPLVIVLGATTKLTRVAAGGFTVTEEVWFTPR